MVSPMIRSMTGFARLERRGGWGTLACEIRTVNHRYLEVSLRLPDELKPLEGDCRQRIGAELNRGKVDASVFLRSLGAAPTAVEIDPGALDSLLERVADVRSRLPEAAPINPLDVLRWPGVTREIERDPSEILAATRALLDATLAELTAAREREGARLRESVLQRTCAMRSLAETVKMRLPEVEARQRERLADRVSQLGATPDADRLEQELVLFAHKMDVAEEVDRLASHVAEVESILDSDEPVGRRLDFLMQELNREANTLSSKSQDAETTRAAVDMKVAIEQMREQIQNIE
jgi:uncharacterized protein (TIGR00255 family)